MLIPDYQSFMKPLLELAGDRREHSLKEAYLSLTDRFELTANERSQLIPSGRQETYKNRIAWARTYLSKAGLLENTRRAHFKITDRGLDELQNHGDEISTSYLKKFEEFVEFQTPNKETTNKEKPSVGSATGQTPEEAKGYVGQQAGGHRRRRRLAYGVQNTVVLVDGAPVDQAFPK